MLRSLALAFVLLFALLWTMTTYRTTGRALASIDPTTHAALHTDIAATAAITTGNLITVTTTDDELNADGDCSLREALQAAFRDAAEDNCLAGDNGDTINIPAGHYTLTLGQLHITGTVTLQGSITSTTVLDGNELSRVLYIEDSAVATLLYLTLQHGNSVCNYCEATDANGGGIANHGATMIAYSTIRNNQAGYANPEDSEYFGGKGGGVFNSGTLLLAFSTLYGNKAGESGCNIYCSSTGVDGGGIYNSGVMTVTNSTLSNNEAGDGAFGWAHATPLCGHGGEGGAIANAGTLTLDNATVTGNSPGIVPIYVDFPCEPAEDYDGEVGGLYNEPAASLTMKNSIIAGNQRSDCQGTVTSYGYNVIQTLNDCNVEGPFLQWSEQFRPLQDNGGPTVTHALRPNSPAIDAGDCTDSSGITVTLDQRGEARPQGDGCDIGAFESPFTTTFTLHNTELPLITYHPAPCLIVNPACNLTNEMALHDYAPAWSPDGNRIAFLRSEAEDSLAGEEAGIYVMDADGSDAERVSQFGGRPVWSPNGAKLAFGGHSESYIDVYVMDANGTNLTNLTADSTGNQNDPVWSPDGNKLVYESYAEGDVDFALPTLYVMNADGSEKIMLSDHAYATASPWSPDSSRLIYHDVNFGGVIHAVNVDGSNHITISSSALHYSGFLWSPDGSKLAGRCTSHDPSADGICVMNHDGSAVVQLPNVYSGSYQIVWSPDSSRLLLQSRYRNINDISIINVDGTFYRRLAELPNYRFIGDAVWSPDSRKIAFVTSETGNREIYVLGVEE